MNKGGVYAALEDGFIVAVRNNKIRKISRILQNRGRLKQIIVLMSKINEDTWSLYLLKDG